MAVTAGDGDSALVDCKTVYVETRCEVDCRGHGAEPVYAHEVVLQRDRRRVFGVELARNGAVLNIQGFGIVPNDNIWLHRR